MIMIKLFTWLTNLFQSMESQCLIDTINFIKIKNHFNHFLNIFAFLLHSDIHFLPQVYFGISQYKLEKNNSLQLNSVL